MDNLSSVGAFLSNLPWGGVLGGFLLAQLGTFGWRWREANKQKRAVRSLIAFEMASNSYKIKTLRLEVENEANRQKASMVEVKNVSATALDTLRIMGLNPLGNMGLSPDLGKPIQLVVQKKAFESLIKDLPHAYSTPELAGILGCYDLFNQLEQSVAKTIGQGKVFKPADLEALYECIDRALAYVDDCLAKISAIVQPPPPLVEIHLESFQPLGLRSRTKKLFQRFKPKARPIK